MSFHADREEFRMSTDPAKLCPECEGALRHEYVPGVLALACVQCGTVLELGPPEWVAWVESARQRIEQRIRESWERLDRSRQQLEPRQWD
jgi:hypothetical protein